LSGTTLVLAGDVMTGRGIDQILQHPGDPRLHERWVHSAGDYVRLAEQKNGQIPRQVTPGYIWGDALARMVQAQSDVRIINLETAITSRGEPWADKGIHYRMHPRNVGCLTVAGIDCCVLANNHVLDYSRQGLLDTLVALDLAGLAVAGAGRDASGAASLALLDVGSGSRVVVAGLAAPSSGVPGSWAAESSRPGVTLIRRFDHDAAERVAERIGEVVKPGDTVVVSIHWGGNWGYIVPPAHQRFARALIDRAGVHVVHGHSSHHPMGIEVYRERLILYGCGDLINDYEGIRGHDEYRSDLRLLYLATVDPTDGRLIRLELVPLRTRRFRLENATAADAAWMASRLTVESRSLGAAVEATAGGLRLVW